MINKNQQYLALLILIILRLFGNNALYAQNAECSDNNTLSQEEINFLGYDIVTTTKINENGYADGNDNNINISHGEKLYLFVDWFNLPLREHHFKYEIFDMGANAWLNYRFLDNPNTVKWYTYVSVPFNREFEPEGDLLIRVTLDDVFVVEKMINVNLVY